MAARAFFGLMRCERERAALKCVRTVRFGQVAKKHR